MKEITIKHPGGVGDGILYSPLIKSIASEYDVVYFGVNNLDKLYNTLYSDTQNIKFGSGTNIFKLQLKDAVEHPSWRNLTWTRNDEIENKLYLEIINKVGSDYVVMHHRENDNVGRKILPMNLNINDKNIPIINLDDSWLRKNGFSIESILHYGKVLNNAIEIHVYEGSFMNFADSVVKNVPLFGHLYCKPHYFDKTVPMGHYEIIKYIKAGKWHKNNWNYLWPELE